MIEASGKTGKIDSQFLIKGPEVLPFPSLTSPPEFSLDSGIYFD
jgi:hypothetical protein